MTLEECREGVQRAKARIREASDAGSSDGSPLLRGIVRHPLLIVGGGILGILVLGRFRVLRLLVPALPLLLRSPAVWSFGARAVTSLLKRSGSR